MEIELKHAHVSEDGDYYQFLFETDEDEGPYVLIQRQFEDADGGRCYVETHQEEYIGHARIQQAQLSRRRFVVDLDRRRHAHIDVTFSSTDEEFGVLRRVLKIMIPKLNVKLEDAG